MPAREEGALRLAAAPSPRHVPATPVGAARPNAAPASARGLQPTQGRPARPLRFPDHVVVVRLYARPARAAFL